VANTGQLWPTLARRLPTVAVCLPTLANTLATLHYESGSRPVKQMKRISRPVKQMKPISLPGETSETYFTKTARNETYFISFHLLRPTPLDSQPLPQNPMKRFTKK
jgi:hypothetical protein